MSERERESARERKERRGGFEIINLEFLFSSAINGRIDQVNQVLELDRENTGTARYNAMDKWTAQLQSLHLAVVNKTT